MHTNSAWWVFIFATRCNIRVCLQACASAALGVYSLQAWELVCVVWQMKALFRRTHQSPAFSPGLLLFLFSYDFTSVFFFFTHCVSHVFTLFDLCYGKVLSAFHDIKCSCQGWQDWSDGLSRHWKLTLWGFDSRSAPLYFARPPLAAFSFVSPLIGQTKMLRDRAVGLVNSPQVSIYFEYLFIYFSGYFYCAFFFSSLFLLLFVFLLYNSCTCTVCSCSKGQCSMWSPFLKG